MSTTKTEDTLCAAGRPIKFDSYSIEPIAKLSVFKVNARLFKKLKLDIAEGNSYEIHQLFKTIHFRGANANLHADCLELIYSAILYFATQQDIHCCSDLSRVFIDTLKKAEVKKATADLTNKVKHIHAALRAGSEERNEFTVAILKWSGILVDQEVSHSPTSSVNDEKSWLEQEKVNSINCQKKFGYVGFHKEFGLNLWSEKSYVQARYHFLHSNDGDSFAKMTIECHLAYGIPSEYDLFCAQVTLQYLFLRNRLAASNFFLSYIQNHPQSSTKTTTTKPTTDFPLINFIRFLLEVVRNPKDSKVYLNLVNIYKPCLSSDPSFNDYLERIGQFYFGIKKPVRMDKGGNMLSNLMRTLTSSAGGQMNFPSLLGGGQSRMSGAHGADENESEEEDEDEENVVSDDILD